MLHKTLVNPPPKSILEESIKQAKPQFEIYCHPRICTPIDRLP